MSFDDLWILQEKNQATITAMNTVIWRHRSILSAISKALGDIKREDKKTFGFYERWLWEKTNGMKYGIKSFLQRAGKNSRQKSREKGVEISTYARMKEDAKLADQVDPRAMAKMKNATEISGRQIWMMLL